MAVLQDTYADTLATGYAGMVANGETSNRISRTCEDAGGIAFGAPVYRGSGDHGCTATVGTAATFLGFAIAHEALGLLSGQTADEYAQYDDVAILTEGVIWVTATGANADGAAVTIGTGAGAADAIGDTAADATHIAATGWVFDDTTSATGLARIAKR
ncbi:structural cement protein Gp24 [Brevundimonas sp. LjRoot202]|uniref:structural cement protein Gp24 n=1 Tax=Brevundimonas sp. LjRoot202 TaxID=3342281 RepID=UPI003ED002B6